MFDWQTDDDAKWLEPPKRPTSTGGWRRVVRKVLGRWQTAVFFIIILLISGIIMWLNYRADEAVATTKQDVLRIHQLIQQAVLDGDIELFTSMLSPETASWALMQQQLVVAELFFNREAMGLWYDGESQTPIITLSPDLKQAQVVSPLLYITQDGEKITLERTSIYRHNGRNWQLAPFDEAFWGELHTKKDWVQATYYEQDQAIVLQLANDLEQIRTDLCRLLDYCRHDYPQAFDFNGELIEFNTHYRAISADRSSIHFPSPTIVGMPTDATSYAALRDGYAGWMAAVMLRHIDQSVNKSMPRRYPEEPSIILKELGLNMPPITRYPVTPPSQPILMQCQGDLWAYDGEWKAVLDGKWQYTWNNEWIYPSDEQREWLFTTTTSKPFHLSVSPNGSVLYSGDDIFTPVITSTTKLVPLAMSRFPQFEGGWVDGNKWYSSESFLIWSPDGRYTLQIVDGMIWLGDGVGRPLQKIENGRFPFWIDPTSYGYVRDNNDIVQLTLSDSVLPEQMVPTITPLQLMADLPEEQRPKKLVLEKITAVSLDRWFIESNAGTIVFNPQTNTSEAVVFTDNGVVNKNGRFFAHHENGTVQLYNLQEGEVTKYATLAQSDVQLQWSADGEWLLMADEEMLHLIEAQTGGEFVIEHGMRGCKTAVFIEDTNQN